MPSVLQERLQSLVALEAEVGVLDRTLAQLELQASLPCFVPVTTQAFLPGQVLQSRTLTVRLGLDLFLDTTASAAREVVRRRLAWVRAERERLGRVVDELAAKADAMALFLVQASSAGVPASGPGELEGRDYVTLVHGRTEEGLDVVEIKERYHPDPAPPLAPTSTDNADRISPRSTQAVAPNGRASLDAFDRDLLSKLEALVVKGEEVDAEGDGGDASSTSSAPGEEGENPDLELELEEEDEIENEVEAVSEHEGEATAHPARPKSAVKGASSPDESASQPSPKRVSFCSSVPAQASGDMRASVGSSSTTTLAPAAAPAPAPVIHAPAAPPRRTPILQDVVRENDWPSNPMDADVDEASSGFGSEGEDPSADPQYGVRSAGRPREPDAEPDPSDIEEELERSLLVKQASLAYYSKRSRLQQANLLEQASGVIYDEETHSYLTTDGVVIDQRDYLARLRHQIAQEARDAASALPSDLGAWGSNAYPVFAEDGSWTLPARLRPPHGHQGAGDGGVGWNEKGEPPLLLTFMAGAALPARPSARLMAARPAPAPAINSTTVRKPSLFKAARAAAREATPAPPANR